MLATATVPAAGGFLPDVVTWVLRALAGGDLEALCFLAAGDLDALRFFGAADFLAVFFAGAAFLADVFDPDAAMKLPNADDITVSDHNKSTAKEVNIFVKIG